MEGLNVTASWKKVTLVSWEALVVASLLWIRSAMASGDQRSASDTFPGTGQRTLHWVHGHEHMSSWDLDIGA